MQPLLTIFVAAFFLGGFPPKAEAKDFRKSYKEMVSSRHRYLELVEAEKLHNAKVLRKKAVYETTRTRLLWAKIYRKDEPRVQISGKHYNITSISTRVMPEYPGDIRLDTEDVCYDTYFPIPGIRDDECYGSLVRNADLPHQQKISCGRFSSIQELEEACQQDRFCVAFTTQNGNPECLIGATNDPRFLKFEKKRCVFAVGKICYQYEDKQPSKKLHPTPSENTNTYLVRDQPSYPVEMSAVWIARLLDLLVIKGVYTTVNILYNL